jgi:hypothetical protein
VSGVLTCGSLSLNGATINGTCSVTGDLTTSSSLSINGHKIQNHVKNSVALTNCTTYGVHTSYPNFNMTSNSQNGYVVSANINNATAYYVYTTALSSWNSSSNYSVSTGNYNGTSFTSTTNKGSIYGDYNTIQFPSSILLSSYTLVFQDVYNYPSIFSLCASTNNTTWTEISEQILTTVLPTNRTLIIPINNNQYLNTFYTYFRLIIRQLAFPLGDASAPSLGYVKISTLLFDGTANTSLSYFPSNVEIGISNYSSSIPDTTYVLTVNGNVNVNGYISKSNYQIGETVCVVFCGSSIGNLPIQNNNITSTSYLTIFQFTYEPKISTSIIGIEFDCGYSINGSGSDEWYSRIAIDGITIIEKKQNTNGRTGVLFPIMGNFINSSYSPTATQKTIYIQVRRGSLFNTLTVDNNNSSLKITEIFN